MPFAAVILITTSTTTIQEKLIIISVDQHFREICCGFNDEIKSQNCASRNGIHLIKSVSWLNVSVDQGDCRHKRPGSFLRKTSKVFHEDIWRLCSDYATAIALHRNNFGSWPLFLRNLRAGNDKMEAKLFQLPRHLNEHYHAKHQLPWKNNWPWSCRRNIHI